MTHSKDSKWQSLTKIEKSFKIQNLEFSFRKFLTSAVLRNEMKQNASIFESKLNKMLIYGNRFLLKHVIMTSL